MYTHSLQHRHTLFSRSLAHWTLCATSLWWSWAGLFWAGLASLRLIYQHRHTHTHLPIRIHTTKTQRSLALWSEPKRPCRHRSICTKQPGPAGSLDWTWPDTRTHSIHKHDGSWMAAYGTFQQNIQNCWKIQCEQQTAALKVVFRHVWMLHFQLRGGPQQPWETIRMWPSELTKGKY